MPATIYYFTFPYITFNLDRLNSQKYKPINSENNEYFIHTKQVKQGNNQFTQYATMLKRLRLKININNINKINQCCSNIR